MAVLYAHPALPSYRILLCGLPSTCCRAIIPLTPSPPQKVLVVDASCLAESPAAAGQALKLCLLRSCTGISPSVASISTSLCTTIGQSQYHRSIVGVAVKSRAGKGCQSHKEEGGWHRLGYRSIRQNRPVQGCVSPLMPKGVMRQTWRSPRSPVILVVGATGLGVCIWHSPIDRPRAESIGQSHGWASASHNPTVSKSAQVDACGAYRNPTPRTVKLTCKPLTRHPCTAQPRQPAGAPRREAFSRLAGCYHECKESPRQLSLQRFLAEGSAMVRRQGRSRPRGAGLSWYFGQREADLQR